MLQEKKTGTLPGRWSWLVIVLAVYLVRVIAWAMAELWYDEVLTLTHFVIGGEDASFWRIFRVYPMANNHMLCSALYWWWLRFLNFNMSAEHLLRLPSLICGALSIALVLCHWRRWLGEALAHAGGMMLAISVVFTGFAYQLRGYSLSMLLATAAVSAAMELTRDKAARWAQWLLCACGLLLPLAVPSNVLVLASLALFLLGALHRRGMSWRRCVLRILPFALSVCLGGGYYFTLWPAFVKASREAGGWESSWLVAGQLLLALLAHGGILALALLPVTWAQVRRWWLAKNAEKEEAPEELPADDGDDDAAFLSSWLFFCCVVPVLVLLIVTGPGRAPFPRAFLGFVPLWTFAILLAARAWPWCRRLDFAVLILLVLANGFLWERGAEALTISQRLQGLYPQNLLQQYYRGANQLRGLVQIMQDEGWQDGSMVLTNEYDGPTFRFYWALFGNDGRQVQSWNHVMPDLWQRAIAGQPGRRLWAVAHSKQAAAELFQRAGADPALPIELVAQHGDRGLFVLVQPSMPKPVRRKAPQRHLI
ncbi:MAG: hypothetical protein GX945_15365 [Lentisphaerae bacterium]|nr:hypothetical protein [Lentisphaerota bacterium]